jgi:serralysin
LGDYYSYMRNSGEARGDDYRGIEGFIGSAFNDKFIVDDQPNIVRAMAGNDVVDGGIGNDRLFGGSGDDLILGSVGDDYLEGNPGNDRLNGGIGSDTLIGGLGNDTFTFSAALNASNLDHVFDFSNVAGNNDNIHLDHRFFGGVTNANLASTVFFGAAAHDASDRIIYDHTTGLLSYDADGNGSQAAVAFAQLENKAVLTLADFVVI